MSCDLRLDVAGELALDLLEVGANRFEDVREGGWRLFHGDAARLNQTILARRVSTRTGRSSRGEQPVARGWARRPNTRSKLAVTSRSRSPGASPRRGNRLRGVDDPGRLVPLAAVRHRREVRAVGLDQQPIGGRRGRRSPAASPAFGKRDDAGEREVEAEVERAPRQVAPSRRSSGTRRATSPPPSSRRIASVSSSASRVWMTTGRPRPRGRGGPGPGTRRAARRGGEKS